MQKTIPVTLLIALGVGVCAGYAGTAAGPGVSPEQTAAGLEAKGDSLRGQQEYTDAVKCYRQAIRAGGDQAALYNKIGLANLRLHWYGAAESAFEQAYKRNRKDPKVLNNLGVASHLQRKYDRAVRWYKKALALNETEAAFHYNLGGSWFALGLFDRARAEYARALELDPAAFAKMEEQGIAGQTSDVDRGRLYYLLAKLYAGRGEMGRALGALQKSRDAGYRDLDNVYRDKDFAGLWKDARLAQIVRR